MGETKNKMTLEEKTKTLENIYEDARDKSRMYLKSTYNYFRIIDPTYSSEMFDEKIKSGSFKESRDELERLWISTAEGKYQEFIEGDAVKKYALWMKSHNNPGFINEISIPEEKGFKKYYGSDISNLCKESKVTKTTDVTKAMIKGVAHGMLYSLSEGHFDEYDTLRYLQHAIASAYISNSLSDSTTVKLLEKLSRKSNNVSERVKSEIKLYEKKD